MTKGALNRSTDLLAKAMRRVFAETVQKDGKPAPDGVDDRRKEVDANLGLHREDVAASVKVRAKR